MIIKVLHVIRSIEPTTGGPSFAVKQMARSLAVDGVSVDIATTIYSNKATEGVSSMVPTVESGIRCFCFPRLMDDTWSFLRKLWEWLKDNIRNYDVLHISGVFTFSVMVTAQEEKK